MYITKPHPSRHFTEYGKTEMRWNYDIYWAGNDSDIDSWRIAFPWACHKWRLLLLDRLQFQ